MVGTTVRRIAAISTAVLLLAGCEDGEPFAFLSQPETTETDGADVSTTRLIERDVEAPDVFEENDAGLWDGRPSLGGVWVAYPDVQDPERVIIRNTDNGKFVIGALFRRERLSPGPTFQVSSDAAQALDMLAGQPAALNVTALRKEEVEEITELPVTDTADAGEIEETALDPTALAAAAIDEAEATGDVTPNPAPVSAPATGSTPAAAPASSSLSKPFVQIGIFSIQNNADTTQENLENNGLVARVLEQESQGQTFYRVVVGPAQTKADADTALAKAKELGFTDAYFVRN